MKERAQMSPEDDERSELDCFTISTADAKWWETAEGHRFALEVLQLRLRRNILKFLGQEGNNKTVEEIEKEFNLNSTQAIYHLAMLEKGLVIKRAEGGYKATATGMLYLEKVEGRL
jgi:hypothetical protein